MNYKTKTLKNGMRIVVIPMPNSLTTTVLVLTETGSKYESKDINGISHFLEHMCFKGTEKRPSSRLISVELDSLGASYNAFTGHEYTGYYAKSENCHFDPIVDIVSDIYLHATFPETEIEKERGVIVGEIEMYEDNPQAHVRDVFTDLLYGNQPAGWNIAGTRKNVRLLKRDDFLKYKASHYVARSTTVVVAGNMVPDDVFKKVGEAFQAIPHSQKKNKEKVDDSQDKPRVKVSYKDTQQTHLVLGFRSYDTHNKKNVAVSVLEDVLGGGMSSRLFHRIREELGAGYYIGASNSELSDHGYFTIYTGVDTSRVREIVEAILGEVRLIRDTDIDEMELNKAKNHIIGNMFSGLETSDALTMYYGGLAVMRNPFKTPQELAEEIRAVTIRDVRRVAKEIFRNDRLNLALVGPHGRSRQFAPILKL